MEDYTVDLVRSTLNTANGIDSGPKEFAVRVTDPGAIDPLVKYNVVSLACVPVCVCVCLGGGHQRGGKGHPRH